LAHFTVSLQPGRHPLVLIQNLNNLRLHIEKSANLLAPPAGDAIIHRMNIQYLELSPASAARLSDEIVSIYAAAFAPPPYLRGETEAQTFAGIFAQHCGREGFRCIVARAGSDQPLVGFVYGFASLPGQWWYDQVAQRMPPELQARWLHNSFELTELAVLPSHQGLGIGGQLHDRLLNGLPQRTALLSTMQTETNAMALYRKRGWQPLLHDFLFSGAARLYVILGKDLPPRAPHLDGRQK